MITGTNQATSKVLDLGTSRGLVANREMAPTEGVATASQDTRAGTPAVDIKEEAPPPTEIRRKNDAEVVRSVIKFFQVCHSVYPNLSQDEAWADWLGFQDNELKVDMTKMYDELKRHNTSQRQGAAEGASDSTNRGNQSVPISKGVDDLTAEGQR